MPKYAIQCSVTISGRAERSTFAAKIINLGLIAGWVKLKTIKIHVFSHPAKRLAISTVCGRQAASGSLTRRSQRFFGCFPAKATWEQKR